MKFLFILILMSFLITWIIRAAIKYFAASIFERVSEQSRNRQRQSNRSSRREGEMKIENTTQHEKKVNKNTGEYVDYEEIN